MNFVRVQTGGGGALNLSVSRGIRVRFGVRRVSSARIDARNAAERVLMRRVDRSTGVRARARVCRCLSFAFVKLPFGTFFGIGKFTMRNPNASSLVV